MSIIIIINNQPNLGWYADGNVNLAEIKETEMTSFGLDCPSSKRVTEILVQFWAFLQTTTPFWTSTKLKFAMAGMASSLFFWTEPLRME